MEKPDLEDICLQALGLESSEVISHRESDLLLEMQEVACFWALEESPLRQPAPMVKTRLMAALAGLIADSESGDRFSSQTDACVITDSRGCIEWVNPAFTAMCGYSLPELLGKKPGALLQGEGTDLKMARAMSNAVREESFCTQDILNYHKDGQPYWVSVSISPILGADRRARGFIALERKLDRAVAAA